MLSIYIQGVSVGHRGQGNEARETLDLCVCSLDRAHVAIRRSHSTSPFPGNDRAGVTLRSAVM